MDLGCGPQYLRELLDGEYRYTGVDLYKHKIDTIVCDFNKKEFITCNEKFDVVFVAGVFEYIYDIKWLVKQISKVSDKYFVCTYNFKNFAKGKADIWVKLISVEKFLKYVYRFGFSLLKFETYVDGQMTYMVFIKDKYTLV